MEYILGARERTSRVVRDIVLKDKAADGPARARAPAGRDPAVGQGSARGHREGRAALHRHASTRPRPRKDREDRQAIIDGLQAQLKKGDKALVGNSAYRRYLRKTARQRLRDRSGQARRGGPLRRRHRAQDQRQGHALQAVIRYRDLLEVEALFRAAKASFDTTAHLPPVLTPLSAATCSVPSWPWHSPRN